MIAWISLDELDAVRSAGETVLVEALSSDFHAAGHLPGAVNLPLSSTVDEIAEFAASHPATALLVVYGSRDGGEAAELAERLVAVGRSNVAILAGGKEAWVEAGQTLERSPSD